MQPFISVIIPNHNGGQTIALCLQAALASDYENFEVIVVDDNSIDHSTEIIEKFSCKLIKLPEHGGASVARNTGARHSSGEILFFIDADCLLQVDTLSVVARTMSDTIDEVIVGGTYTPVPYDQGFFSTFQSVFIYYSDTKNLKSPDYLASHALVISAGNFQKSGGFAEDFMPILEDVEYSHRLRRQGFTLQMSAQILVQHIFLFSLSRSLKNAFRKSSYWFRYSVKNKDILADSGTASAELKFNVAAWGLIVALLVIGHFTQETLLLLPVPVIILADLYLSRHFLAIFRDKIGTAFAVKAALYYILLYPMAISAGIASGLLDHLLGSKG